MRKIPERTLRVGGSFSRSFKCFQGLGKYFPLNIGYKKWLLKQENMLEQCEAPLRNHFLIQNGLLSDGSDNTATLTTLFRVRNRGRHAALTEKSMKMTIHHTYIPTENILLLKWVRGWVLSGRWKNWHKNLEYGIGGVRMMQKKPGKMCP